LLTEKKFPDIHVAPFGHITLTNSQAVIFSYLCNLRATEEIIKANFIV